MYLGSSGHLNRGPGGTYPPMAGRTKAHNNGNSIICATNNGAFQLMPHPASTHAENANREQFLEPVRFLLVTAPIVIARCFTRNVRKFSPRSVGAALDSQLDNARL